MLIIEQLDAGYGKKQVLFGVSLEVQHGEIVALIGPNGAGKSTVLKAVCGLIPAWKGEIHFRDERIDGSPPPRNVERGITFCPQGNRVFDGLGVRENLEIGGCRLPARELGQRIDAVLALFPALKDRLKERAGNLSGGEQQMLAVGRALIPKPRLLLLDEPSLGLSPNVVRVVFDSIRKISEDSGTAILVVEQKVREVLSIAQRVYSLRLGQVAFTGPASELRDDRGRLRELFL